MNYKMMGRFGAQVLCVVSAFMLPPFFISLFSDTPRDCLAFLFAILAGLLLSGVMALFSRGAKSGFYAREGLICAGAGWILMSIVGCLPFVISGCIPHFVDALFETVSGFTTTGASILADVESMPRGMLFWRSFISFLT